MGQILDHAEKQIKKHLRPESNTSDLIEKRVHDMKKNDTWPFTTVTPENFLNSVRPLLQIVYDIHSESGDAFKDKPVELFKDGLHSRVIDMLKCVQAMEYETKSQDIKENLSHLRGDPVSPEHDRMYEVLAWAKEELYRCAKHANAYMKDVYAITEATPLDIEKEWEKKVIPRIAIAETRAMQKKHEPAFHRLTQLFDPLLKHGLPSETKLGQWLDARRKDEFRARPQDDLVTKTLAEIKAINEGAVKDLVRAQLELDRIENIVIPRMKLEMMDLQAKATYEDVAIDKAGIRGKSDYWTDYREYDRALKNIETIIKNMREREKARLHDATLSITCAKDGTYTLTAERTTGRKSSITIKEGEATIKKDSTTLGTRLKRVMNLGAMTTALRTEAKQYEAMIREFYKTKTEPTHDPEKKNEQKKTVVEREYGKVRLTKERSTRFSGNRFVRLKLDALAARLSRESSKTYDDGIEKKTRHERKVSIEVGGHGTAEIGMGGETGKWGAKVSAEAGVSGKAKIGIFGFSAKAGPSAQMGKMMSFTDFQSAVKDIFAESIKQNDPNAGVEKVKELLRDIGPQKAMEWGVFSMEAWDFKLGQVNHKVETNEQSLSHTHTIEAKSPLFNDAYDMVQKARDAYQFFQGETAYGSIEKPNENAGPNHEAVLDR